MIAGVGAHPGEQRRRRDGLQERAVRIELVVSMTASA